jgi:hypothetical protein
MSDENKTISLREALVDADRKNLEGFEVVEQHYLTRTRGDKSVGVLITLREKDDTFSVRRVDRFGKLSPEDRATAAKAATISKVTKKQKKANLVMQDMIFDLTKEEGYEVRNRSRPGTDEDAVNASESDKTGSRAPKSKVLAFGAPDEDHPIALYLERGSKAIKVTTLHLAGGATTESIDGESDVKNRMLSLIMEYEREGFKPVAKNREGGKKDKQVKEEKPKKEEAAADSDDGASSSDEE